MEPRRLARGLLVTGPEMCGDAILWALERKAMPYVTYAMKLSRWFGAEVKEVA